MNYKKKWQALLLKKLRTQGEVKLETRNSAELKYLSELEEAGKIELSSSGSGSWTCRPKQTTQQDI